MAFAAVVQVLLANLTARGFDARQWFDRPRGCGMKLDDRAIHEAHLLTATSAKP